MGPGTASGVFSERTGIGRKSQMEKKQLQMIIDKLSNYPGNPNSLAADPSFSSIATGNTRRGGRNIQNKSLSVSNANDFNQMKSKAKRNRKA